MFLSTFLHRTVFRSITRSDPPPLWAACRKRRIACLALRHATTALLGGLVLAGCRDASERPDVTRPDGSVALQSEGELQPNETLARYLALALNERGLRAGLLQAIHRSPVSEGKLLLSADGSGPAAGIVAAMARAGNVGPQEVRDIIASLPPLEIYLPVPAHRAQWAGGDDLLVATALDEDDVPFGVDLAGEPVSLSADAPPNRPTLVLVPAESFEEDGSVFPPLRRSPAASFSEMCDPMTAITPCDTGGGAGSSFYNDFPSNAVWGRNIGIRENIRYMRTPNDHEPWHKGAPEFYVMLAGTSNSQPNLELSKVLFIDEGIWAGSDDDKNALPRLYNPALKLVDWDTDYGTRVRIRCMERDINYNATLNLSGTTVLAGLTIAFNGTFQFGDSDDNCGTDYITPRFSNGNWSRIPDGPDHAGSPNYDGTSELQWFGYGVDVTS